MECINSNKAKERKKKRMEQKEMEKFCVAIVIEKKNGLQHIGYRCCRVQIKK
jgi:hypothetical protein